MATLIRITKPQALADKEVSRTLVLQASFLNRLVLFTDTENSKQEGLKLRNQKS